MARTNMDPALAARLAVARAAMDALPIFDGRTAPITDFTCALSHGGQDVPVEFTDEMVPSGMHHKVRCPSGHVTNGIPAKRFRL